MRQFTAVTAQDRAAFRHDYARYRLHEAACAARGARRYGFDPAIVAECLTAVREWRDERRAAWRALGAATGERWAA